MRAKTLILIFILLSILLLTLSIFFTAQPLYQKKLEKRRIENIQKVYYKEYYKRRDFHIPKRSLLLAQKEINQLIKNHKPEEKQQLLIQTISILNNIKEKFVLKIEVHTAKKGSKRELLKYSKIEAKELKNFIQNRTEIPFISSIGYGNRLIKKSQSSQHIKFILQRIKE